MRILTWNIRHGGGTRAGAISAQLLTHEPDLVVLTEYRENPAGTLIRERLASSGLGFTRSSVSIPKVNGVLVAAREPFAVCEVPHLGESSHRALWCRFPTFNVIGYYFPNKHAKPPIFEAMCKLDSSLLTEPSLLIGDFNTGQHYLDEKGATLIGAHYFDRLAELGWVDAWRTRYPQERQFSWFSHVGNGFRLDHALVSRSFDRAVLGVEYSHAERTQGISDHSALIVDVDSARFAG